MNRTSALDSARFRGLLLVIAGVPVAALYLWRTVIEPLLAGALPGDFTDNYLPAAAKIAAGRDPFDLCILGVQRCAGTAPPGYVPLPLAGAQYVTPLPVAWALQPLLHLDQRLQLLVILAVLQASLVLFLWTTLKALGVRGWQMRVFLVLAAIGFEPVAANVDEGQVNLVLLGLSGVWLLAWVGGDRWWGGVALGVGVALKLLQAPLGLLVLWGRRWRMLAAAAAGGLVLWLLAVPQYLPEFVFKVAPLLTAGTGLFENHSPGGTVIRLFDPATFTGASRDTPVAARVITALMALAVLVATFWVLRRSSGKRAGRALEAAAVVAATPLIASYSWGTHLVLLLLPMFVVLDWAIRRRDWGAVALVAAGWLLIGPGHKALQALLLSGYSNLVVLRLMAEFGVVGISAIWVATLLAVLRERSANRTDPAHEDRADREEQDRAREHHPVAEVG